FSRTRRDSLVVLSCLRAQPCPVPRSFPITQPRPAKIFPLICQGMASWPISLIRSLSAAILRHRPRVRAWPLMTSPSMALSRQSQSLPPSLFSAWVFLAWWSAVAHFARVTVRFCASQEPVSDLFPISILKPQDLHENKRSKRILLCRRNALRDASVRWRHGVGGSFFPIGKPERQR